MRVGTSRVGMIRAEYSLPPTATISFEVVPWERQVPHHRFTSHCALRAPRQPLAASHCRVHASHAHKGPCAAVSP
jgi:hypothetical protein